MKYKYGCYDILVKTSAKHPSKVAVRQYEENSKEYNCYTYSEIYGISEYLAQQLRQLNCNRGVIGLISRTNVMVPCVVAAAHKCNTIFTFLDPTKDVHNSLNDFEFTVLITVVKDDGDVINRFYKKPDKIVTLYGYCVCFYNFGRLEPYETKLPNMQSFIAMTSGSTGEAKKIQVPFQCIKPNIDDLTNLFHIDSDDVIYFSTPLTFDPAMVEMLLASMNGASLLIAPGTTEVLFPSDKQHSVTVWQTTPSKFFQYSNAHIKNRILSAKSTLKILALGGEPLNGVKRLKQLKHHDNKTRIFTLYGVTEMSCWACVAELDLKKSIDDHEVPLGRCLSETEIMVEPDPKIEKPLGKIILASKTRTCYIMDKKSAGEQLTSLKFVDTGDLGQVGHNGTIYYRGRKDDIIKRFGHKINLQFIESAALYCPRVKACSCVWLPKPRLLIVYFTSEVLSSQDMSDFLRCKLDDRHWPDKIVRVDNMPINAHGKISKMLLSKVTEKARNSPVSPSSSKVKFIVELRRMLNCHSPYDDIKDKTFIDIGGTSFLAVQLCNKLAATYPEFGKLLLPYLLSPIRTINQIMSIVENQIRSPAAKPKKRMKIDSKNIPSTSRSSSVMLYSKNSSSTVAVEFVEMWTYNFGKCVDASPSVILAGVNLYVTTGSHSGRIAVIDALTGTVVGVISLKTRIEATALCRLGDDTMPTCAIVGAYDGTVICFTIETCKEIWRTNINSMIKSKAASTNGRVYVAGYDGYVKELDLLTGKILSSVMISEQPISADLVLAKNEYVMVGSLSGVCAAVHLKTHSLAWQAPMDSPIFADPVLYNNEKYVVFAEVSGEIHCRTVEKGIKIWQYSGAKGNIFSSIHVRETGAYKVQMVFGCYDSNLYSINVHNFQPSLHWKLLLSSPIYSTPSALSGNMILAATNDGNLNIISADYGVMVSQYALPSETFSSPAVYGDYIFIGCRNDLLYSLRYIFNF